MGIKIYYTGLFLIVAFPEWQPVDVPAFGIVGAILMLIGLILLWFDK